MNPDTAIQGILAMVEALPPDWRDWAGHRTRILTAILDQEFGFLSRIEALAVAVEILLEEEGGLLGHVDREVIVCSLARIRDLASA